MSSSTSREARPDRGLLQPHPPPRERALRVVGPGRLERGLRGRIETLEHELDAARLVERGGQRRQDRLERELALARESAGLAQQRERRLVLALGVAHGENAELRRRLGELEALAAPGSPAPRLAAAAAPRDARRGLLERLFAARSRPRHRDGGA